jgi:hypothetical protein
VPYDTVMFHPYSGGHEKWTNITASLRPTTTFDSAGPQGNIRVPCHKLDLDRASNYTYD